MLIHLHGPDGDHARSIPLQPQSGRFDFPTESDKTEKHLNGVHRRGCFAYVRKLKLDADRFWRAVKTHYAVSSSSELSVETWATLFARLRAAEGDPILRRQLLDRIGYREDDKHDARLTVIYPNGSQRTIWKGALDAKIIKRAVNYQARTGHVLRLFFKDIMFVFKAREAWESESPRFYRIHSTPNSKRWMEFQPNSTILKGVGGARNYALLIAITEAVDVQITCKNGYDVLFELQGL